MVQVRYGALNVPCLLQDGMFTASVTEDGIPWGELTVCLTAAMKKMQDVRPRNIMKNSNYCNMSN